MKVKETRNHESTRNHGSWSILNRDVMVGQLMTDTKNKFNFMYEIADVVKTPMTTFVKRS